MITLQVVSNFILPQALRLLSQRGALFLPKKFVLPDKQLNRAVSDDKLIQLSLVVTAPLRNHAKWVSRTCPFY